MISTEDRIVNEAGELFFRHGIRTITMDDIASKMAISKKTIYQYFEDKDMLVKSFAQKALTTQLEEMHTIRKQSEDAIDEIMKTMTHLGIFLNRVNPAFFLDMQKHHPSTWNMFRIFREKELVQFVEDNLRRGIKQGLYRENLKVKILARMRLEESEMGFNQDIFPPQHFNVVDVQITMLDHFLHGILSLKGLKLLSKYQLLSKEN
ncbi:MAG: TetR/AcrR family transcriptional regulator [Bacteroidetes bacterium]|nr:TetR/AcrR family transcriptional regulator [Bacteroidota bacterium]